MKLALIVMLPQLEIVRVLVAVSVPFKDNGATIDVTLTGVFSVSVIKVPSIFLYTVVVIFLLFSL